MLASRIWLSPALPAAGRASGSVAAAARAGAERSGRARVDRAARRAAELGVVPPGSAARRAGSCARRRSSADRRDSYYTVDLAGCREQLQAAGGALHPGLSLGRGTTVKTRREACAAPEAAGPVPVYREQRAFADRRGAARSEVRRGGRSCVRREPSEAAASQRSPGDEETAGSTSAKIAPSMSTRSSRSASTSWSRCAIG